MVQLEVWPHGQRSRHQPRSLSKTGSISVLFSYFVTMFLVLYFCILLSPKRQQIGNKLATVASAAIYFCPVLQIRHNRSKLSLVHFCLFVFCLHIFLYCCILSFCISRSTKFTIPASAASETIYFSPVLQLHHNRTKLSLVHFCVLCFLFLYFTFMF